MPCDVVWLKRDLRLADHQPLAAGAAAAAAAAGGTPLLVLFCYEPSLVTAPDFGFCHLQFINESLQDMRDQLQQLGGSLVVRHGEAVDVLSALHAELATAGIAGGIGQLWSHEETGTPPSTARNAAVAGWAQQHGVKWTECQQTGVVRNLETRDGWSKHWTQLMEQPMLPPPTHLSCVDGVKSGRLMSAAELGVQGEAKPEAMAGGESRAQQLLESFLGGRAAGYSSNMSSPNSAWDGCSRLSPYLAWGCISLRCVHQRAKALAGELRARKGGKGAGKGNGRSSKKATNGCAGGGGHGGKRACRGTQAADDAGDVIDEQELGGISAGEGGGGGLAAVEDALAGLCAADAAGGGDGDSKVSSGGGGAASGGEAVGLKDLAAFTARLRWRSHFMQKLEDEPDLVCHNMCRAYDGARNEQAPDPVLFQAWCKGATGYPLVDAVVRCLLRGGWVNFRMRAMIFSFAAYHLWLHWRFTADFMAAHFLDYEPGIHYPQAQMQAGTTGINALRVYNPSKQVVDHDPQGAFIKRYVPELAAVPPQYLAEPWKMPAAVQQQCGCVIGSDYPQPVVPLEAGRENSRQLYAVKASLKAKEEAAQVYNKHGSRKRPSSSGGRGAGGRGGGRGRGRGRGIAVQASAAAGSGDG